MHLLGKTLATVVVLALASTAATAGVLVTDSHNPRVLSAKAQLIQDCVSAIHGHWHTSDGLVLKRRARYGTTADGIKVVTVEGSVWQDGERASVSHQCSNRPGPNRLALNVQVENQVAEARSNTL